MLFLCILGVSAVTTVVVDEADQKNAQGSGTRVDKLPERRRQHLF
jgi:hypothetical protein